MRPTDPGPRRPWGFRLVLTMAILLNLVVLGLVLRRPAAPPDPGALPTPPPVSIGPNPAFTTPTPPPVSIGPNPAFVTPTSPAEAIGPNPVFPTLTPLAHVQNPAGKIRGLNIPVWGPDFVIATPSIHSAPAIGANWVSLVTHWYVRSAVPITDGLIFQETGVLDDGQGRTASDASIGRAIDAAHAQGLKVMLKPHVDWTAGGWRGSFYFGPHNAPGRDAWWSSYHTLISDTVALALAHGADAICIGTEFTDINKEPASAPQWISVINQIRAAGYAGALTYAANWGLGADAEYNRPGLAGVWEQLDFIGVDAYYPLSADRDPSQAALVAGWHTPLNQWDNGPYAELDLLHRRTGKPVVFTEVGYPALDYAAKNPCCEETGLANEALQSRAAAAMYQVWQDVPWWNGAFWWQYGPTYNSLSLQGRPILDFLRQQWTTGAAR